MQGCYRSCFQEMVLKECNCGDPRFPILEGEGHHYCEVGDPVARRFCSHNIYTFLIFNASHISACTGKCLDELTNQLGGLHGSFRCRCQQPCHQSAYSVTYSAAKWPSQSLKVQLSESACQTPEECNIHFKSVSIMQNFPASTITFQRQWCNGGSLLRTVKFRNAS
jgi:hypothetical protein